MNAFSKLMKMIFDKKYRFSILSSRGFYDKMSDEEFLKKAFLVRTGRQLDLDNPKTFNEKLQWLKLYDRKPVYSKMVDKYEAKSFASSLIGADHIIKTIAVYNSVDEIDFKALPERFVLKCAHDSGGIIVCRDKSNLDIKKSKKFLKHYLKRRYFYEHREWPYKNVPPRIIAEEFMENASGEPLIDYKFYCFNGEGPKFLYVSKGLENHSTATISFLNLDWSFAPFGRKDYKPFLTLLSKNTMFLRVDLYEINGKVYFSELTFTPGAGYTPFENESQDLEIGKMLNLPI